MFKNSSIDFGRAAVLATCFTVVAAGHVRREPKGERDFYLGVTTAFVTIAAVTATKAARHGVVRKPKTDFVDVSNSYLEQGREALLQGNKSKALKLFEQGHEALYHANGDRLRSVFLPASHALIYESVLQLKQSIIGLQIESLKKEMQPELPKQRLLGSGPKVLLLAAPH